MDGMVFVQRITFFLKKQPALIFITGFNLTLMMAYEEIVKKYM